MADLPADMVEAAARAQYEHSWRRAMDDPTNDIGPWEELDEADRVAWHDIVRPGLAAALATGEVRTEWATRHVDIESGRHVVTPCPDRSAADRMHEHLDEVWGHHAQLLSRTVLTSPWEEVSDGG